MIRPELLKSVGTNGGEYARWAEKLRVTALPDMLAKLEAQDRGQNAKVLIDDLPLFQVAVRRDEAARNRGTSKVEEALKAIDLDDLTPRAALDALYELKKKLSQAG